MMSLPATFVRKEAIPRLVKRKKAKTTFGSLPFVDIKKSIAKGQASAWDVPASGGYFGGYETGKALAILFLKHERAHGLPEMTFNLTDVMQSFLIRFEQEGGWAAWGRSRLPNAPKTNEGVNALRGQFVGFVNTISDWVTGAARGYGYTLDVLKEEDLLADANKGLAFDHVAYMGSLSNEDAETEAPSTHVMEKEAA